MIRLSVPTLEGREWEYVRECLETGWISSAGRYVVAFEEAIAGYVGAPGAVGVVNGTAGLHIALMTCGVRAGDLVIVPNLTFVASANAIVYAGAEPVLVDADSLTWQIDLDLLEAYLRNDCEQRDGQCVRRSDGRRLAAIMPVHILGNMCDMERLCALAAAHGVVVVEDASEALGTTYGNHHAGTLGRMGVFSFNGNKIISTGGGGMIVSHDTELLARAKHLTTQAKTTPEEYFHDAVGYNYRLVNVLAAIGVAQLEQLPGFLARKREHAATYRRRLQADGVSRFHQTPTGVQENFWLNTLKVPDKTAALQALAAADIEARPFWVPMNRLPMYSGAEYVSRRDVAGDLYDQCVSVPSSASLSDQDVDWVCDTLAPLLEGSTGA